MIFLGVAHSLGNPHIFVADAHFRGHDTSSSCNPLPLQKMKKRESIILKSMFTTVLFLFKEYQFN